MVAVARGWSCAKTCKILVQQVYNHLCQIMPVHDMTLLVGFVILGTKCLKKHFDIQRVGAVMLFLNPGAMKKLAGACCCLIRGAMWYLISVGNHHNQESASS